MLGENLVILVISTAEEDLGCIRFVSGSHLLRYSRSELIGMEYINLLPKSLHMFHSEPRLFYRFFTNPNAITRVFNHSSDIYIVNG
jgi:hypothetical protein